MISALLAFVASPSGPDGLGAPSLLLDQGKLLSVTEGHADLAMYDLDGDGAKDMIVGQFKDGLIRFYKNHAEKGSPKFEGFEYLKAAGAEIKIDAG